jgi:N-formylglutamate amidohydrolase
MVRHRNEECGFSLHNAEQPAFPILLSVPHAGREYPQSLLNKLRVSPEELVRLEDRYADRLVQHAISSGMTAIVAHRARAWIDLNRSEDDLDPEMVFSNGEALSFAPSAKTRGGLGLIPRRLAGCGELWNGKHDLALIKERLSVYHRPYHMAVEKNLNAMHARFGVALLLDIHSMPPLHRPQSWHAAQVVVGDLFGKSASARYSETALSVTRHHKVTASLNHPYSGDHMLRRHGRPGCNIHAVQLEIDRTLYLDELLREPGAGLSTTASMISNIAFALSDQCGWALPIAAE